MSHATVLIAISKQELNFQGGVEQAIAFQMAPFDENDECFRDGSRWDWYEIGGRYEGRLLGRNVIQVKDLDANALRASRRKMWQDQWEEASAKDATTRSFIYDIQPGDTLESYLARNVKDSSPLVAYAFLRNRHWNEGERMGWFGTSTATECERKNPADPDKAFGKCLHKDEESGARIISWNEPFEHWNENFWRRFIEPLPPDETLAMVDYHV